MPGPEVCHCNPFHGLLCREGLDPSAGRRGRRPLQWQPGSFIVAANVRGGQRAGRPTTCPFTQSLHNFPPCRIHLRQGDLCRGCCRCCWAGMPMSTAWPAAFMNAMACAAWPSAAARACPRWPTAVWCGSPCRTRRSGQDHVFTATLLGLAAQYPRRAQKFSSPAPTATRPCWPAMPPRAARGVPLFACPPPAALHLADKRQFAAACRAAGLRTPQTVTLCPADAPAAAAVWLAGHRQARGPSGLRPLRFPGAAQGVSRSGRRPAAGAPCRRGAGRLFWQLARAGVHPGPDTRLGVVNAYCAADGSVPWLVQGQPFCRSARPRAPATTPPCWWSRPGRTRRCWMPCAAFAGGGLARLCQF